MLELCGCLDAVMACAGIASRAAGCRCRYDWDQSEGGREKKELQWERRLARDVLGPPSLPGCVRSTLSRSAPQSAERVVAGSSLLCAQLGVSTTQKADSALLPVPVTQALAAAAAARWLLMASFISFSSCCFDAAGAAAGAVPFLPSGAAPLACCLPAPAPAGAALPLAAGAALEALAAASLAGVDAGFAAGAGAGLAAAAGAGLALAAVAAAGAGLSLAVAAGEALAPCLGSGRAWAGPRSATGADGSVQVGGVTASAGLSHSTRLRRCVECVGGEKVCLTVAACVGSAASAQPACRLPYYGSIQHGSPALRAAPRRT